MWEVRRLCIKIFMAVVIYSDILYQNLMSYGNKYNSVVWSNY